MRISRVSQCKIINRINESAPISNLRKTNKLKNTNFLERSSFLCYFAGKCERKLVLPTKQLLGNMKLLSDEIVEKFKQMKFETTHPFFYTQQILSLSFFQVIPHPGFLQLILGSTFANGCNLLKTSCGKFFLFAVHTMLCAQFCILKFEARKLGGKSLPAKSS